VLSVLCVVCPLCCLSFELLILNTPFLSSNSSHNIPTTINYLVDTADAEKC
jgi:hypothetical protein